MKVDLLWIGEDAAPAWPLGAVHPARPDPASVAAATERALAAPGADFLLFWGARLGAPDPERVLAAAAARGDAWHAGLRLGLGGLPAVVDPVRATWMFGRDPDPAIEATSWRTSLEATLVRRSVVARLGGPRAGFDTLAAAGLEMGYRWLARGALVRHAPALLPETFPASPPVRLTAADEVRFARAHFGGFWSRWALGRRVLAGEMGSAEAARAWRTASAEPVPPLPPPYPHAADPAIDLSGARITVVLPTLERYPWLATVLRQLGGQTVPPREVIVVDQTPAEDRDPAFYEGFPDLPLTVLWQDAPGQCSSRNAALARATGDFVAFLDDDIEIAPDFLERALRTLLSTGADACCGEVDEPGVQSERAEVLRASEVFPGGVSLVRRAALAKVGGFDLALERGANEDHELGVRLYLAGCLVVLDPSLRALHHRAPRGGLRAHGARVVTRGTSRARLSHRRLPGATELYVELRHATPRQRREGLWIRAAGTAVVRGSLPRRLAKAGLAALLLPDTLRRLRESLRAAEALLRAGPRIPPLPAPEEDPSGAAV